MIFRSDLNLKIDKHGKIGTVVVRSGALSEEWIESGAVVPEDKNKIPNTMKISFSINGAAKSIEISDENTPLLWVVRDILNLKGTKFGCGKAACGACTLHVDGEAIRSCSYPVKFAEGKQVTTIEGLGNEENPHPVQQAWIEEIVPQCGYCQPGFMMATAALLNKIPKPTDEDIDQNISNVCRCATYYRMRKAIYRAAELTQSTTQNTEENV